MSIFSPSLAIVLATLALAAGTTNAEGKKLSAGFVAAERQTARIDDARFDVQPLGDSVYAIIRREPMGFAVNGNSLVIVCDSDVVVVDTDFTRDAANEVIAAIRRITPKPVRFVVNTHWPDDHVMGNQAYQDAFPGIQFIAHENTRDGILNDAVANRTQQSQAPRPVWTTSAAPSSRGRASPVERLATTSVPRGRARSPSCGSTSPRRQRPASSLRR